MVPTPLVLEVIQTTPLNTKWQTKELNLGDGYEQTASVGKKGVLIDYGITSGYLSVADSMNVVNQLTNWRGVQSFLWSPKVGVAARVFVCSQWQVVLTKADRRQITATFQEVVK